MGHLTVYQIVAPLAELAPQEPFKPLIFFSTVLAVVFEVDTADDRDLADARVLQLGA